VAADDGVNAPRRQGRGEDVAHPELRCGRPGGALRRRPLPGEAEHPLGEVDPDDAVAELGQQEGEEAGAGAHVQHVRWRRGQQGA
jgi:hypothetical protein